MSEAQEFAAECRAIGSRIAELRRSSGLTQEEASAAAGIDLKRWQRIEAGGVNPTLRTLSRVAKVLGRTLWALFQSD